MLTCYTLFRRPTTAVRSHETETKGESDILEEKEEGIKPSKTQLISAMKIISSCLKFNNFEKIINNNLI